MVAIQLKSSAPLEDTDGTYISSTSSELGIRRKGTTNFIIGDPFETGQVAVAENIYHIIRLTYDSVAGQYSLAVNNGTPVVTNVFGGTTPGALQLFYNGFTYGNKEICELFITTDLLGSIDIAQAEAYLNTKFNVY
jgi:hypothetical protein